MYKVIIGSRCVEKEIDRLSDTEYKRIDAVIRKLKTTPRPHGCVKLKGKIYRIRVGAYRIIYQIDDKTRTVEIGRVVRREKDIYKW